LGSLDAAPRCRVDQYVITYFAYAKLPKQASRFTTKQRVSVSLRLTREVFPYINFCMVPPFFFQKTGVLAVATGVQYPRFVREGKTLGGIAIGTEIH